MARTLWTIGYGGRRPTEFIALVREAEVACIADVRHSPRGSLGCYTKAGSAERGIEKLLGDAGIRYCWLPELGNPQRHDPTLGQFREVIVPQLTERTRRIIVLANESATCLLCACRHPAGCHRKLIADWFAEQGWAIVNLE